MRRSMRMSRSISISRSISKRISESTSGRARICNSIHTLKSIIISTRARY